MFYIHIGAHKTGSSTLQDVFYANAKILAEHGVFYPPINKNKTSHTLLTHEVFKTADQGVVGEGVAELARLASEHPDRTFLLSSENFELFKERHIQHVLKAIGPHHEIRIIAYVRDLTTVAVSKYNQRTKTGMNIADFDAFCGLAENWGQLAYFDAIERWAHHAGWQNVRVRSLDKRSLSGGELVSDAVDAIGLGPDALASFDPESLSPSNESPSWISVEFMRAAYAELDSAGLDWASLSDHPRVVVRNVRQPGGEPFQSRRLKDIEFACAAIDDQLDLRNQKVRYLTPEQWQRLRGDYLAQVDRLNEHLVGASIPLPEDGPPPERPFLPTFEAVAPDMRAAFVEHFRQHFRWRRLPDEVSALLRGWLADLEPEAGGGRRSSAA